MLGKIFVSVPELAGGVQLYILFEKFFVHFSCSGLWLRRCRLSGDAFHHLLFRRLALQVQGSVAAVQSSLISASLASLSTVVAPCHVLSELMWLQIERINLNLCIIRVFQLYVSLLIGSIRMVLINSEVFPSQNYSIQRLPLSPGLHIR